MKAAVQAYFGIDLSKIDPAQAAIIAGLPKSPSNYDLVRNAIEQCTTVVAEDADCPEVDSWSSPGRRPIVQRRNQILDLLADRSDPAVGRPVHVRRIHRREERGRRAGQPGHAALDGTAFHLGRPRRARRQGLRRRHPDLQGARERRPAGHDHARYEHPEDRREVGPGSGDRAACQEPHRRRQGARLQEARAVDGEPANQGPPQRRARRATTTRPAS